MGWFSSTFNASIGKKALMAVSGLFLCTFLVVHLAGNLQLLEEEGLAFNAYANFMTSNEIVNILSIITYSSIVMHAIVSLFLTIENRKARPVGYKVSKNQSLWSSRNMGVLGTIILVFIVIHMSDFWYEYHWGEIPKETYTNEQGVKVTYKNLYHVTRTAFHEAWYVAIYVFSMIAIGFHLYHGFESGFRTLGVSHNKYIPFIRRFGKIFSVVIPAGFAFIPIYIYFTA